MPPHDPHEQPILNSCPACGHHMDVSDFEPFAKVLCPACGNSIRVRHLFHHFVIKEEIGHGGMSRVFRAEDTSLGRDVALKILNRHCMEDKKRIEQFEREARITAAISHPNVVKVFSSGADQGYFYIAMELVTGGSLDEKIRDYQRIGELPLLEIAVQLARGFKAAQDAGLIHRDIKPGNILFSGNSTPKIVDFGLALMSHDTDTDTEIWATPYYVPPEKLYGREDHRSDIYSLGASLFHAAFGRPPVDRDTVSLEELKELKSQPVKLTKPEQALVSEETRQIILSCLEIEPDQRTGTYADLIKNLEFAIHNLRRPKSRRGKPVWKHPAVLAGAAVVLLTCAVLPFVLKDSPPVKPKGGGLLMDTDPLAATDQSLSSKYTTARNNLLQGQFLEAEAVFTSLAPKAPQPTRNWCHFHAGIAHLLAGKSEEAQAAFSQMDGTAGGELQSFFTKSRELLTSAEPIRGEATSSFQANSFESITLLAAGLKNWDAARPALAHAQWKRFAEADPKSQSWVAPYKDLIQASYADAQQLAALPELDHASPQLESITNQWKIAVAGLRSSPVKDRLQKWLDRQAEDIAKAIEAIKAASAGGMEQLVKLEMDRIDKLIADSISSAGGLRFAEGADVLKKEPVKSDAARSRIKEEVALFENAAGFLNTLAKDLAAVTAEVELPRAKGLAPLKGKIVSATPNGLSFRPVGGSGEVAVPFSEIPAHALIRLAEQPLLDDKIADTDEYYRRREEIVAFALRTGQLVLGSLKGNELASENRGFRDRWKHIQPSIEQ